MMRLLPAKPGGVRAEVKCEPESADELNEAVTSLTAVTGEREALRRDTAHVDGDGLRARRFAVVPDIMRALESEVVDVLWQSIKPLLPAPSRTRPLGCHRRRLPDRLCFRGILIRLVTGAS